MTKPITPSELALTRKRVLDRAEKVGWEAACEREGMSRTSYYKWKKRYDELGMPGLEDQPTSDPSHPHALSEDGRRKALYLSQSNPSAGSEALAAEMKQKVFFDVGGPASKTTVQKVLDAAGRGTREARWLAEEERRRDFRQRGVFQLAEHQDFLEAMNPNQRHFYEPAEVPGALLYADVISLGQVAALGDLSVMIVVDARSSYVFARVGDNDTAISGTKLFTDKLLPFFAEHGLTVRAISFSPSKVFEHGRGAFSEMLQKGGITVVERTWAGSRTSGFAERFVRAVKHEFLQSRGSESVTSLEALRADFKAWMRTYNGSPQHGFPNYGASPLEVIKQSC